ncbi:hypothetical protein JOF53_005435 [Crossiella equi]|uniref:Terpene synthase n=1 Tax=Crossiella equi TaxID=130796 RepID=A0ABS5AJ18_9PSEU|nr:terpene synthase family protein [Crossiella equi]MBP2476563.1 hypothetical protein [Crossiella equi]
MSAPTSMLGLSGPGMGLTRRSAFAPSGGTGQPHPHGVHFGGGALPEFYLPFEPKVSPHLDRAREHAAAWARRIGLAKAGVWTDAWTDEMDYGYWAATAAPSAAPEVLEWITALGLWGFHYDDFMDDRFKRTRNLPMASAYVDRLLTFLPRDLSAMPEPADPVEAGLADLWATAVLPPGGREALPGRIAEYLRGPLWETHNIVLGRVPDPVDYLEMRRQTSAGELCHAMALAAAGGELPEAVREHRTMRAIREVFTDVPGLRNDIVSYDKEMYREGEPHNAVLVTQHFFGCGRERATGIVNDLITQRLRQFERLVAEDVPALVAELGLGVADQAVLYRVLGALRDWLAGDALWAPQCARYR